MYALAQLRFTVRDASSVHQKQSVAGCAERSGAPGILRAVWELA